MHTDSDLNANLRRLWNASTCPAAHLATTATDLATSAGLATATRFATATDFSAHFATPAHFSTNFATSTHPATEFGDLFALGFRGATGHGQNSTGTLHFPIRPVKTGIATSGNGFSQNLMATNE